MVLKALRHGGAELVERPQDATCVIATRKDERDLPVSGMVRRVLAVWAQ